MTDHARSRLIQVVIWTALSVLADLPVIARAEWIHETVDSAGDVGNDIALTLDPVGNPLIAYTKCAGKLGTESHLKLARHDGTDWSIETVCSDGDKGHSPSIALDNAGHVHITHWDIADSVICRTWHDGSIWRTETIDATPGTGEHSCLVIDDTDRIRVAYSCLTAGLKLATRESGDWVLEMIDQTPSLFLGVHPSMQMDSQHQPHIAYYGGHSDWSIKYAWNDGTQWQTATIDAQQYLNFPCLVLDESDQAMIAYANWQNWDIRLAVQTGPGPDFTIESLWPGYGCSGLIRGTDRLHLLWKGDGLFYSYRLFTSIEWTTELVAEADILGPGCSLAVDPDGAVLVAFDHDPYGDLILARRTDPEPTPTPTPACIHDGDVNHDGDTTAADAQTAFMIALGLYSPGWEEACAADCTGDAEVTAGDAQAIFLKSLGLGVCTD